METKTNNRLDPASDDGMDVLDTTIKNWFQAYKELHQTMPAAIEETDPRFTEFYQLLRVARYNPLTVPESLSGYSPELSPDDQGEYPLLDQVWKAVSGNSPFFMYAKFGSKVVPKDVFLSYAALEKDHYQSPHYMNGMATFLSEKIVMLADFYIRNTEEEPEKEIVSAFVKQMKDYPEKVEKMVAAYYDVAAQKPNDTPAVQ